MLRVGKEIFRITGPGCPCSSRFFPFIAPLSLSLSQLPSSETSISRLGNTPAPASSSPPGFCHHGRCQPPASSRLGPGCLHRRCASAPRHVRPRHSPGPTALRTGAPCLRGKGFEVGFSSGVSLRGIFMGWLFGLAGPKGRAPDLASKARYKSLGHSRVGKYARPVRQPPDWPGVCSGAARCASASAQWSVA